MLAPYPGPPHTIIPSYSEIFNLLPRPKGARLVIPLSLHPLANTQGLDWGYVDRLVYLILQEALKSLIIILLPSSMVALTASPLLIYSLAGLVP